MKNLLYFGIFFILVFFIHSEARSQKASLNKVENPQITPDSALFAKEHPSPQIVRGFMMGGSSQKDYDDARAWGANVIRIQMSPAGYANRRNEKLWEAWPSFLDQLEGQIKRAKQAGLKVVVDLHSPPFQNVGSFERPEFWNREDLAETFCKVWTDISTRLLPYKDVIWGYDLLNEPLDRSQLPEATKQWRPLAIKIVQAIRKVDPDTWIIYEPGPGSLFNGFKGLIPLPDRHVIYGGHFYYPQDFTHQGVFNITGTDLAKAMEKINLSYPSVINGAQWNKQEFEKILKDADDFQARWKVPIYVGEFSVIRWAPKDAAVRWLKDVVDLFESRNWSWSYHAFREFHGWSLEYDEQFWRQGMPSPQPVTYVTERGAIIKSAFQKNSK
jgi:endoglucanase